MDVTRDDDLNGESVRIDHDVHPTGIVDLVLNDFGDQNIVSHYFTFFRCRFR